VTKNEDGDPTKEDPDKEDPTEVLSTIDKLVQDNKGKGLGVVTGFLTGEGKSIALGALKQAANAAGEKRLLSMETVPLPAAQILIFNALEPTTAPDTSLKTDAEGNYTVVLPEGKYFGFAVHLDLETFSLVTTQIPNISPLADTVVKMDTAIAIEDLTSPSVTSVYDAMAPNSSNIFLVGGIPSANARINVTFSEPMNRESGKSILLGRIDTANSSTTLVLADTIKNAQLSWSGDSKELTLKIAELEEGVQYGIVIPVSCKDLAKNPLEKTYGATFLTVAADELDEVEFAGAATFPADEGKAKPIQNPTVSFNRPVDVFTVMKNASISPNAVGFWEVAGARATFIHKEPLKIGETYTIKMPVSVKDLAGKPLSKEYSFQFSVQDFEGAAKDKSGDEQIVALTVEQMFDAYLQGDLGRFGTYFHPNFRMNEGSKILSRSQFLDDRRLDVAEKQLLSAGIPAPVFDQGNKACQDRIARWKVLPEGGSGDPIWAESYTNAGQIPRFWDKDLNEIAKTELVFEGSSPRLTYKGKKYGFAPDFSRYSGPVNQDNAKNDLRFMSDVMAKTSTLALETIKVMSTEVFQVDGGLVVSGDTAKVAVKMSNEEKYSRTNFDGLRGCDTLEGKHLEILKFLLVRDGVKWVVLTIESSGGDKISQEDFDGKVSMDNFGNTQTQALNLIAPVNQKEKAYNEKSQVVFKWQGSASDSVKGYVVGIAEDNRFCGNRPPYGALFFVKAKAKGDTVSFILDANAQVVGTNASTILKRAQDLRLPGWEKVMFEYVLPKLDDAVKGMAGVYNWKVIAVRDTSASQFLANGFQPQRFYGESDFGNARGFFSVKAMPQGAASNAYVNQADNTQNSGVVNFNDMDQDGYPDFIEQKYGTDMRNRDSYPDFRLDTDGDKMADFLEKMLDKDGSLGLVATKGDESEINDQVEDLKALNIFIDDTDGDGFPNDIEQLFGFNPNDKASNPGTRARAEAPIGVFKGKIAMGDVRHDLSFRTYKDTAGNLWSAYTAAIATDTLVDTVRASFSDLQNTVIFQVILPQDGPNAGKSLWMRGNYDQFQQLLMGPCDLGPSADKKSAVINGGPQAGQWAASGRGEDVSGRLPGGSGSTGNPTTPVNTEITYRFPPTGILEESSIEFTSDGGLILINEFGDTVASIDTAHVRRQPNGFEFQATQRTSINGVTKFIDIGGLLVQKPEAWVIDGHVFMQKDSAGVHKDIPGQMAFKAGPGDIIATGEADILLIGSLEGWIQQDKAGTGLTGQPGTVAGCPPDSVCPGNPGSFGTPYVAGLENFKANLMRLNIQAGATFYVSAGGQVMSIVNDSMHVMPAKAPWCNQVVLKGKIVMAANAPEADKLRIADMQKRLDDGLAMLVVLEAPSQPGVLSVIDKVLDPTGETRTQVIAVEARNPPPEYGTTTMTCTAVPPPNQPPPTNQPQPGNPVLYTGGTQQVTTLLTTSAGQAGLISEDRTSILGVRLNPATVRVEGGFVLVNDATDDLKIFVVLGEANDPMKPMLHNGQIMVAAKAMMAGG